MCLSSIDDKAKYRVKYGYKVMRNVRDGYRGQYYTIGKYYELNKIYRDRSIKGTISIRRGIKYPKGFHVYVNFQSISIDRPSWMVIVKVEINEIVARGYQDGVKVVVAKEMKILGEVDSRGRLKKRFNDKGDK